MLNLSETSIEWALVHLTRYHDSDFFPRLFEFEAIKNDWANIKKYLLTVDLEDYAPKSPIVYLAPKVNNNFRVVHQLDPLDSLILTAIVYENSNKIEAYRIPESRHIACSYRIKPTTDGSFFEKDNTGYIDFIEKAQELSENFLDGFALVCDITDFYNQIYLHRVNNIYEESGSLMGQVLEDFLTGLNTNISKGIPVGPAASTIIAEAIMADIDKKIITFTDSFTRYVDDIYIFFNNEEDANSVLHDLTKYLYSNHRLVFASDKTKIIPVRTFQSSYLNDEDVKEKSALREKLEELISGDYSYVDEIEFEDLEEDDKFKIRSETYKVLFEKASEFEKIDIGLIRHILRQAGRYKIRSIVPLIFPKFNTLLSAIREIVIYFNRVLNDEVVRKYKKEFNDLLTNKYLKIPYINLWIFTLFQNQSFNSISLQIDYSKIIRIREKALIALREKNTVWLKDYKDGIDTLGLWDKRAVLYASTVLSEDEMKHWLGLEISKNDIVNRAICSKVIADKKTKK